MPEPNPPYLQLTIDVSLPDTATDEQREKFRSALDELGASPRLILSFELPPETTPEQRDRFEDALAEALFASPIDIKPIDR